MNVLLVDVPAPLVAGIRRALGAAHAVAELATDLLDPDVTSGSGYDIVVHALGQGGSDEERLLRSTLGTWSLLAPMRRGRYVQLSTMRVLDGYDAGWDVREHWLPRPATDAATMACHVGEITGRELTRTRDVTTIVLRLDDLVAETADVGPRELTFDDAADAVALVCDDTSVRPGSWTPYHAVNGGGRFRLGGLAELSFSPTPHRGPVTPARPSLPGRAGPLTDLPTPRRVTVYGAGGPLGAVTVQALAQCDSVRATDAVDLAALLSRNPQSPGAPVLTPPAAPHEFRTVDVRIYEQVRAAAVGSQCLINVSVIRTDPVQAFGVNMLGAWNVMQAAIAQHVPRVIFTGPTLSIAPFPFATWDRDLDGTQSFRTGDSIYMLTKLLGQEITRLLAEHHRIAAPMLLWCGFVNADQLHGGSPTPDTDFLVSWDDAGRAVRAAADVPALSEPAPVINILAPTPTGRWTTDRAQSLLGFDPADDVQRIWWDARVAET